MNRQQLIDQIYQKKSFLCIGLDTDPLKIPPFMVQEFKNPILEFNKRIIDATKDYCVAYKPNIAFYESMGSKGWEILEETLAYIPDNIFTIADAKRGDIGNTASMYAKTFFDTYNFDSVTVAPYMGSDSVKPFLEFEGKWAIVLGLTSNRGAYDFQFERLKDDQFLYEKVIQTTTNWGTDENLMFVIGATKAEELRRIREIIPNHFLLVPGVGAQGGSLEEVCENGMSKEVGLLINSSRGILYASNGRDFAKAAKNSARAIQIKMRQYLEENNS